MASPKTRKQTPKQTPAKQPVAKTTEKATKPEATPVKKDVPALGKKAIEQKQELINPEVPQQVVVSKELPQKTTMTLQELKDKMASAPFVPSNPLDRFFKR